MPRLVSFRSFAVSLGVIALACAEPPMEPRDPTPGAFHFEVKTFNVLFSRWSDESTVEAVGAGDPDVVMLQEVNPDWEAVLTERYEDEYPHMLFAAQGGAGGLAVLSRYELEDLGVNPGPEDWHPAWRVMAHTPEGPVQLLNVHLRAVFHGRDSEVDALLSVGDDHLTEIQAFTSVCDAALPTVVAGDFNEDLDGEAVQFLENDGFRDALSLFHPTQGTWRHASLGGQLTKAIDHIMFGESLAPLNSWAQDIGESDHIPVMAHLELTPSYQILESP